MKEIIAVIRPNKMQATKDELARIGFPSMTAAKVFGRGKQRGLAAELAFDLPAKLATHGGGMRWIPKRMVSLVVPSKDVSKVVAALIRVNQTGEIGDGRIFVSPIEDAIRVRTQEKGDIALV
ncbi:MAG: P-II family nitrogen regulator [Desulforudis sp.]|jgi:nitrogen regulatory protein PII 2|nr:P-II family nitrogen regulator [Clostridia bacterium]MDQ7791352.1 P-II family nitrogen regulator [Clostridia bacterium]RJX20644.1 MAG: P-II family nitrogen regulator [Desulforudis sp.]